jgi:hypothetical protein
VLLREKFGKEREQPIPPSLVPSLRAHARHRGAARGTDPAFRTRRGCPMTRGVSLWGLEADYEVEATSTPSGVTHVTFTRAGR